MKMSLTARVLTGLVLGLAAGIAISLSPGETLAPIPSLVEPVGTLWVNAIRMTVVPLIISLLITAVAGDHERGLVATLGGRIIGLFVVMVTVICMFTALAAPPLLSLLQLDPATAEALRATTSAATASATVELPPFRDWLVDLIPSNPLKAAVDGTMLPLVVFTVLFALALARIADVQKDAVLRFFVAVKEAMFVLIGWIMAAAPIGVFALMLPLAAQMGATAAGALGYFLLITCGLIVIAMALLYPLAVVAGGVSIASFARACAPAQVVGFSTRSSLASLPAMFTATENLGFSPKVSGLVLPIAVSIFKFASPVGRASGTYFIALLYGIDLSPTDIVVIAGAIGLLSFYSPGIPSGGLLIMTPLYVSLNLPVEGIGILIALDLIVDMFITPANVTANLTVAAMLTRPDRQ
jgi:proton glutamate symport protein